MNDDEILMQIFPGSTFKNCTIKWKDGKIEMITAGHNSLMANAVFVRDNRNGISCKSNHDVGPDPSRN